MSWNEQVSSFIVYSLTVVLDSDIHVLPQRDSFPRPLL